MISLALMETTRLRLALCHGRIPRSNCGKNAVQKSLISQNTIFDGGHGNLPVWLESNLIKLTSINYPLELVT
jgi:hypothetical protein